MSDNESDRDKVADAIRARQSLEGDTDPGGEVLSSPQRQGGLRDLELTDADEALDDDDVELTEDK